MRSKVLLNGKIEVNESGQVYKIKKGTATLAAVYGIGRNNHYLSIKQTMNGKQETFYIHRLVAEAFIPNPENKPCINHKDGNTKNNHVSNLEWCTYRENNIHALVTGLRAPMANGKKCILCQKITLSGDSICPVCKKDINRVNGQLRLKAKWADYAKDINTSNIKGQSKLIVDMRKQGKSFSEIGQVFGITAWAAYRTVRYYKKKQEVLV